jgi:uncharacterized protein YlbG (UPF0298 family)
MGELIYLHRQRKDRHFKFKGEINYTVKEKTESHVIYIDMIV